MVTIAMMGRYTEKEFIYALYTIMNQKNVELELIISMNELDFPACDAIDFINAYRTPKVKRVLLHTEKEISSPFNYFSYVKNNMKGDYLLCLSDGATLVMLDSISKCIKSDDNDSIVMGRIIFTNDKNEYVGELLGGAEDTVEKKLHIVLKGRVAGSVILPKRFIRSSQFVEMNLLDELEDAIINYLDANKENAGITVSSEPLLRFNIEMDCETMDDYVSEVLEQNLQLWENELVVGKLKLNYTGYFELNKLVDKIKRVSFEQRNLIGKEIDARIRYIIKKQKGSKWNIAQSDKAFIVCLMKLLNILWGEEGTYEAKLEVFQEQINYERKIKVAFTISEKFLWLSCYKSIYDAFVRNKERYDVDIVYVPFEHHEINIDQEVQREEWKKSGLVFKDASEYQLDEESPDIIFYCKPYAVPDERWYIKEVEKIIRKVVYVPYNMAIMDSAIQLLTYCLPLHFIAWKQLVFGKQYQQLINMNSYNPDNQLPLGHPKFDISIKDLSPNEQEMISSIKEMAHGRKIFLWNTRWMIHTERGECGTFLNYGIKFLDYIQSAENMFVIWRPHPFFVDALKKYECYEAVLAMKKNAEEAGKMYFDQGESQWVSIFASDVLISDPSSIIGSFVPLKKPVILTMLKEEETVVDEMVYKVTSFQALQKQVAYMIEGKDEMQERREKYIQDNYFLPEGDMSVGEKVVRYIDDNFLCEN